MKRKFDNLINYTDYNFISKEESNDIFILFSKYIGGEIYINENDVIYNLRQLLEGSTNKRLLPGQYSLYIWGPQGRSLWIRNNQNNFEFYEYNDKDIYANPQDKYFNIFKFGYEERIFNNLNIIKYNKN
jgi:hypothetical protein